MGKDKKGNSKKDRNKKGSSKKREEGKQEMVEEIVKKLWMVEKEERMKKIRESRYNANYEKIITESISEYLKGKMKKKDRSIIARYRCSNEPRENYHWKEAMEKRCRICGKKEESVIHILWECETTCSNIQIKEFLNERGEELEIIIMKKIEEEKRNVVERELQSRLIDLYL